MKLSKYNQFIKIEINLRASFHSNKINTGEFFDKK